MLSRIDALVVLGLVVGRLRGTARAQSIPLALQLVAAVLGLLDDVRCDDPDLFEAAAVVDSRIALEKRERLEETVEVLITRSPPPTWSTSTSLTPLRLWKLWVSEEYSCWLSAPTPSGQSPTWMWMTKA